MNNNVATTAVWPRHSACPSTISSFPRTNLFQLAAWHYCCTMLSSTEALTGWSSVLYCLYDIAARAPSWPDQLFMPEDDQHRLHDSLAAVDRQLASPVATWQQLLEQQVSTNTSAPLQYVLSSILSTNLAAYCTCAVLPTADSKHRHPSNEL